jgi:hypothetical protein
MNKILLIIPAIAIGIAVFVLSGVDFTTNSFESTLGNQPTSLSEYPSWVDEGCHPAMSWNGTYYQVCYDG